RREHVELGQRALRRLDSVDALPSAQRSTPHAILQRLLYDQPMEYGEAAGRAGCLLLLRLAAGPDSRSQHRRIAQRVFRSNGTTCVLGADAIGNAEGFSPGRVVRLGIRATF